MILRIIFYLRLLQLMGLKNQQKKFQAPIHPEDPLPVPKYGQIRTKATFDRKVVEIQFFNQNIHDEISLYIFLSLESFCSKMLS